MEKFGFFVGDVIMGIGLPVLVKVSDLGRQHNQPVFAEVLIGNSALSPACTTFLQSSAMP